MFANKDKKIEEELSNKKNQIEQGTKIIGDIVTQGNIRLDGELEGNIDSKSKAVLGVSCNMKGSLRAQNAEISGEVKGTIEISELLTLKSTAVINGDIITSKLTVEEGALINGTTKMGAVVKGINSENDKSKSREQQGKTA